VFWFLGLGRVWVGGLGFGLGGLAVNRPSAPTSGAEGGGSQHSTRRRGDKPLRKERRTQGRNIQSGRGCLRRGRDAKKNRWGKAGVWRARPAKK